MMLKTTLNKIKEKSPCESGWAKLLKHLHKTRADDEELTFKTILESNGIEDAIWCFRCCADNHDKKIRLYAVWCARQVEHLSETPGILKNTNDVSERYAHGEATTEELIAASAAARAASRAASSAAAGAAARAASRAAASAAARAAARAASSAAAGAASSAAARAAQEERFISQFCKEGEKK